MSSLESEEAENVVSPHGMPATEAAGQPHLALVDPGRLRRDCLKLAVQGAGWRVTDMPAIRDLARRLARGEVFDAALIGGASGAAIDGKEVAQLAAAAGHMPILVAADGGNGRYAANLRSVGVLPANASLRMLVSALARIRGDVSVPPDPMPPEAFRTIGSAPPRALTRRQREVLALISKGKSNRLIAAALSLSEETVKVHVKQIIKRLGVANRTQAAVIAAGANTSAPVVLLDGLSQGDR
jgi:DNA-binding NarL/FixJ family response regulator